MTPASTLWSEAHLTDRPRPLNACSTKNTPENPFVFACDTHFAQCLQGVNGQKVQMNQCFQGY